MAFTVAGLNLYVEGIGFRAVGVDTIPRRFEGVLLLRQLLKLRLFKGLWLYKRDIGVVEQLPSPKMIAEPPFEDFKR